MNFFAQLGHRLSDAFHHHPILHEDPLLGSMEEVSQGQWRTLQPVQLLPGMEPVSVTLEADDDGSDLTGRDGYMKLQDRYPDLKAAMTPMICKLATRARPASLWEHAVLSGVDIWHDPESHDLVLALQYQLDHTPEYTYVVRVQQWQPVDVLITG